MQSEAQTASDSTANSLAGVIEGFYGPPWSQDERLELFKWMAGWELNTYLYAPKDDLKHRAIWRELYTEPEVEQLRELIRSAGQNHIRFVYAVSPGLDIRYDEESEFDRLVQRLSQMQELGCRHFALLFDDVPDGLDSVVLSRFGSLASAQCHVANALFKWARHRQPDTRFLFCPTPYCGRMADSKLGGDGYLSTLGAELASGIDVFWTGPEIISREITLAHIQHIQKLLHRKPVIWDNLHANDYDARRFFCGPYSGRASELRQAVGGFLLNPNCEFPLNYVPLHTFAKFVQSDITYDPRKAYVTALEAWWSQFTTVGQPISLDDLILFVDCYYLPHEEGPLARNLQTQIRNLLGRDPAEWGEDAISLRCVLGRLRESCARMTQLRNRPLFQALSRRAWELREELDLIDQYVEFKSQHANQKIRFRSATHLPGTYRGGMVAHLQKLLAFRPDGTFQPASGLRDAPIQTEETDH